MADVLLPRPPKGPTLAAADQSVIKAVTSAFVRFGGERGYLVRHELRAAHLALLGYAPSRLELDLLLPKPESGDEARMELPQFSEIMAHRLSTQDADEQARRAFRAFDRGHKGYVSLDDLREVVLAVAPSLPPRTVELIFSQVDADADGRVSYRDFMTMMAAPRPPG